MAVRVNGEAIPEAAIQYEMDRLVKFYSGHMSPEQIRSQIGALKRKAREQAIGAKLLISETMRLDIRVPSDEIDRTFQEMIDKAGGRENFDKILRRQHLTEAMVRESIEQGRKTNILVERVTSGLSDPTEAEMKAHFGLHAQEYHKPDQAQAQHILIKPASDTSADRETARSRLQEIRSRVQDGADFADEAAAHSECPSGRKTGGSLGWFSRGMMLPEFNNAVFSMEVGALSEIIETKLGFHLIRKTGQQAGGQPEYEEVQDKVRDFLRHVKRGEALAAHIAELREKAVIEED